MSSKCLPSPRIRCFLLHFKLIGFMAQSWGIALAWSRLARVSNSGNSKSRCPENPGCCLQHTLQANPHFCVPRQNPGIGMCGRLAHKVKRKGEIAIENVHMQSVRRCQNKPQQEFKQFFCIIWDFSNGNDEVAIWRCVLPPVGNGWRHSENTVPTPSSSFVRCMLSLI